MFILQKYSFCGTSNAMGCIYSDNRMIEMTYIVSYNWSKVNKDEPGKLYCHLYDHCYRVATSLLSDPQVLRLSPQKEKKNRCHQFLGFIRN